MEPSIAPALAQLVEHLTVNQVVAGSILASGNKNILGLMI